MSYSGTYELRVDGWYGGWRGRPRWEFTNDPKDPLTFEDSNTNLIRPDNHFFTDLGSVPRSLQKAVPIWFDRARFPKSYIYHDSAYKHGGHWFAIAGGWEFRELTRKQVDKYLRQMILAEDGSKTAARLVYWGVRMGGWASWKKKPKDAAE